MNKKIQIIKRSCGAVPTDRRFVIKESYAGKRKLSEVLTEIILEEYRSREQKVNK